VKTIARSVAVALLTAGAVAVPASAEAIAAPFHAPASATLAAPSSARGDHHGRYLYRHDDLRRYRGDFRDHWRHGSYRYCGWDRDCDRGWYDSSRSWDCSPYWRR